MFDYNHRRHHPGAYNPSELDWMKLRRLSLENPTEPDRDEAARAWRLQQLEHVKQQIADYKERQCYTYIAFTCYIICCVLCAFVSTFIFVVAVNKSKGAS